MPRRKIIKIDEDKCTGCGLCVPACAEGAIQIIDGKARLVSETFCDGLGTCLGDCPEDAIRIEEREVEAFDEEAVRKHLEESEKLQAESPTESRPPGRTLDETPAARRTEADPAGEPKPAFACPGMALRDLRDKRAAPAPPAKTGSEEGEEKSQLQNWPIQMHLVPVDAPWLQNAHLLVAADCVPFALAGFHERFLASNDGRNRPLIIGCPKLDDGAAYREKLSRIFAQNHIEAVEVLYMEVPCCHGLVQIVREALGDSGKEIPLILSKIGIRGGVRES